MQLFSLKVQKLIRLYDYFIGTISLGKDMLGKMTAKSRDAIHISVTDTGM
jgi:hypothetical protein